MHLIKFVLFSILVEVLTTPTQGARILAIAPIPSYSHQIVFHPLWRELSLRGHQLTVLTTNPVNDPALTNLTEIDLHLSYEIWTNFSVVNEAQKGIIKMFEMGMKVTTAMLEEQLNHPDVQTLIKNETEHFDLVIAEGIFPGLFAFAERFKAPLILITSRDAPFFTYDTIGNPAHPVLNPDCILPFAGELSFVERLMSTGYILLSKYLIAARMSSLQQETIEKHFGKGFPLVEEIARNASMLFVNADPVFHRIRPLLPNVIQIRGGTHLQASKPLPKDLQKALDAATQGFIYFSLGSNVKSKDLPETTLKALLQTFAELPYTILWKFELEDLPEKSSNIIISKWFPQQDIFKHPNIKLFITQGGLQSMEEAIYNHIPIIGMPFFTDQPTNMKRMVAKGVGLSVDYSTVDKEQLMSTILEVISNPKYRDRAKEMAELAQDQPMTGLDRAVWWSEYVIRHKGAKHLRSPALDLPLYQYFLLDVIGFCLLVVLVASYLVVTLVKLVFKLMFWLFRSKPKVKTQ